MKKILDNIHLLSLGAVNAYLIESGDRLILIDTGYSNKATAELISKYFSKINRSFKDITDIIVTHHHMDHSGGIETFKAIANPTVYMHKDDAAMVEQGITMRENIVAGPGLFNRFVYSLFIKNIPKKMASAQVDKFISDGEYLQLGAGFEVISIPGHSKGQIALLYKDHGGVLIAADAISNLWGLGTAFCYEDLDQGYKDIKRLSLESFEVALFGHGKPILSGADKKIRAYARKLNSKR